MRSVVVCGVLVLLLMVSGGQTTLNVTVRALDVQYDERSRTFLKIYAHHERR